MFSRKSVYIFFICLTVLSSCKKDPLPSNNDYKTLGTASHEMLASSTYSSLQIQISYMPGFAPDAAAVSSLVNFLNILINKPGGIQVQQQQIDASGKTTLSITDIVATEKKYRTLFTSGNSMAVHILITDGVYNTPDILGTSYWNTSICIFGKTVHDYSGGFGQLTTTKLYTLLFEHEFGHLLGLVNQGAPMVINHQDATHGAHCNNTACLMHYDVESTNIGSTVIPSLDANCMADLKANGGK